MSSPEHDASKAEWDAVRARLARAREEPLSQEDAERRLAAGGSEPVSTDRIEELVSAATADTGSAAAARPRPSSLLQRSPWMKAAAVLLVFGLFGVTSGVLIKSIVWPSSKNPTQTLSYAEAVQILTDPAEAPQRRQSAQVRVFRWVEFGVRTLRQSAAEGGPVGAAAERLLAALRDDLQRRPPFEPVAMERAATLLAKYVLDTRRPLAQRLASQAELARQTRCGLTALFAVASTNATATLQLSTEVALQRLEAQLAR